MSIALGGGPVGSVVIPAWNEANVIERTLRTLFDDVNGVAFEVVVACNGCTDGTPEIARATGLPIVVLDVPQANKAAAIRAAEAASTVLPRLYLDADVELRGRSAVAVLAALRSDAIAARPPAHYVTDRSSRLVRWFFGVKRQLPSVMADLCGAGVYGLSAVARQRFGNFPDVSGDDLFAARVVTADEVMIVDCEPALVRVPRDAGSLVRTLARAYRGNRELEASIPGLATSTMASTGRDLRELAKNPLRWPGLVLYGAVVATARAWSYRSSRRWDRDSSARQVVESRR